MKDKLKNIWNRIKGFWNGLTKSVKIIIIAGASVIIVGAIVLTVVMNTVGGDDFIVLFPGMSTDETAEVYSALKNQGVEIEINSDGEIEVRESQWDDLVYDMAQLGYPQTAPSYGTFFDNLSMTMTEFEKQQTLRFELQDRLQTTLKRIDGIKAAIVTITFPESSDYAWQENTEKAKASVTLTLTNSAAFTPENVSAVKNLVAFSAQQIEPENVTVIDSTTGEAMLSSEEAEAQNSNDGIDYAEKMEYVGAIEKKYEDKVKVLLQNMFPDGVDVVASVEIDYNKVIEEMRQLLPQEDTNQGFITHQDVGYNTDEEPVDQGGVVGEEPNDDIPNYQNDEEQNLNSDNTNRYDRSVDIDWGYLLTQTERAQGTVSDASISVIVTTENAYMSRDLRNSVIQLVKNATNIDEDKISVYSRAIPVPDDQNDDTDKNGLTDLQRRILIIGGLALLLLLVILGVVVFLLLRRAKKRRLREQAEHEQAISELSQKLEEAETRSIEEQAGEHNKKEKATEEEVREFAKNNPEITAALIRSMLKERDE